MPVGHGLRAEPFGRVRHRPRKNDLRIQGIAPRTRRRKPPFQLDRRSDRHHGLRPAAERLPHRGRRRFALPLPLLGFRLGGLGPDHAHRLRGGAAPLRPHLLTGVSASGTAGAPSRHGAPQRTGPRGCSPPPTGPRAGSAATRSTMRRPVPTATSPIPGCARASGCASAPRGP